MSTECRSVHESDGDSLWFGDHSFSYLTLGDILDANYGSVVNESAVVFFPAYVLLMLDREDDPEASPLYSFRSTTRPMVTESEFLRKYESLSAPDRCKVASKAGDGSYGLPEDLGAQCAVVHWSRSFARIMEYFTSRVTLRLLGELQRRDMCGRYDKVRVVFGFDS